ncbi:hypothetical protein WH221_21695 [Chryseobacterium culicis]|uniref:Uncharacterized protein n=1 Tax=Chryseobacterium culicis TaxID=680127 RepID=A0A2S9CJW0_CHRCI|nr:hypothetical protein [Chryseobacterium culicis]PRB80798.1 hypothetical protein CQ022_21625 [Chryseobacterium culicis]PRB87647.1 hypothetical protein CQ033_21630 [Chryseobacterium culicis]
MENKETEINELLVRLSKELPHDYEIADFWDGDLTAVGIRVGNHLIYIYQRLIITKLIDIILSLKIIIQEQ